jgi:cytochrome c
MPFQAPQSLPNDEVYAITAYVLYLNEIVEDDFELNKETFSTITMPNQDSFYRDDRPDVQAQRCMENCKSEPAKITSEPENSTYFADSTIQYTAPSAMATTATTVTVAETAKVESAGNTNTLGQDTYQAACALCHTAGLAGAPVTGDATQWQERLAKGEEALGQSSLNGIGAMPAKGGQAQLSDEAVLAAVKYMLDELGQ